MPFPSSTLTIEALLHRVEQLEHGRLQDRLLIEELTEENKTLEGRWADEKWQHSLTKSALTRCKHKLERRDKEIVALKEALRLSLLPLNSSNSSRPPSTDIFKPKRNSRYSLRTKSGRKPGGQPGHKGYTLAFDPREADALIVHQPEVCMGCGKDLSAVAAKREEVHQVIDIAVPRKVIINHVALLKECSCGHCNKGIFPAGAQGQVNYGANLRAMVANLSARQYMPYKRTVELISDIYDIAISQGTITHLLIQFDKSAQASYEQIRRQLLAESVVGADETDAQVGGSKGWFHTYQNEQYTFIGYHPSRGEIAREHFYPHGLPRSILVTDCLAMQLSTPAAAHQLCLAHLLRELNAMEEAHPQMTWPGKMKQLLLDALDLRGSPDLEDKKKEIKKRFDRLIAKDLSEAPGKIPAFWKRMKNHRDKVFTFLDHPQVPGENNASERAIRNVKVKQKVSGQFKTPEGASRYAVIRSVIDTANKQKKNIHETLVQIATLA